MLLCPRVRTARRQMQLKAPPSLAPLRETEWVAAKEPFGGVQAVLAYLSRYTHRVAISNRRLISAA
jgi:Putative transposase